MKKIIIIILSLILLFQLQSCSSLLVKGLSKIAIKEISKNSQAQYPTRTPTIKPIIMPNIGATLDAKSKDYPNLSTQLALIKPQLTQIADNEKSGSIDTDTFDLPCYVWSDVTKSSIGQNICVYGEVYTTRYVVDNFQILFSKDPFAFYFEVIDGYFELNPGECIYFEGEVKKSPSGHPYFQIGEYIYECETWME